ncbi:MAG: transposase [Bacteroidia bacterium]|nr:transposase [Bacteroidia bacterium]
MSFVIQYHHIVFGTYKNQHTITPSLETPLHNYLFGIGRNNNMKCHAIGGISNHVHLLVSLQATLSVSKAAQILKSNSSKWVNDEERTSTIFRWREGYAAISVSPKQVGRVMNYISNQKEHHRLKSFTEECEAMLRAFSGYNPDERGEHTSWFMDDDNEED